MAVEGKMKERISDSNWFIYALKLENENYYIGLALNPQKRFLQHEEQGKRASGWCKKHKAIEIIEIVETPTKRLFDAMVLEDLLALEYIKKYGSQKVHGGIYLGTIKDVDRKSKFHIKRGYISLRHVFYEKFNIGYQDLLDSKIYDFISKYNARSSLYKLLMDTEVYENVKSIILEEKKKVMT